MRLVYGESWIYTTPIPVNSNKPSLKPKKCTSVNITKPFEIEERERRRFRPFVWVVRQDGAHSFWTAVGERQVKVLWFPDAILRYRFSGSFDTSIVLDINGNVTEENGGRFLLSEVWLALH